MQGEDSSGLKTHQFVPMDLGLFFFLIKHITSAPTNPHGLAGYYQVPEKTKHKEGRFMLDRAIFRSGSTCMHCPGQRYKGFGDSSSHDIHTLVDNLHRNTIGFLSSDWTRFGVQFAAASLGFKFERVFT